MQKKHRDLTKKQMALLRFLYGFHRAYGNSPALKVIVEELKLGSNRSAIDMLRLLINKGYLKPAAKVSRSTQLTPMALDKLMIKPAVFTLQPHPPYRSADSQFSNRSGAGPVFATDAPKWVGNSQPSGSQLKDQEEFLKLLGNTVSSLAQIGGTRYNDRSTIHNSLYALVLFGVFGVTIFIIFGHSIEAAVLLALGMSIISIRSVR